MITVKEALTIKHAQDCAYAVSKQDPCTCSLAWDRSYDEDALGKTVVFQPATFEGPQDFFGLAGINERGKAELQKFIATKQLISVQTALPATSSTQLYRPLLEGEIRILELHPAQTDDALHGKLHVVNIDFAVTPEKNFTAHTNYAVSLVLEKPVWYTALSYVWGPPEFDRIINFDGGGSTKITSSLAAALQHLRSTGHSVFLWIDQICINQADVREKEKQIPMMGLIYTKATNTMIWLGGDEKSDPGLAFNTMESIYARLQLSDAQVTVEDFKRLDFPPSMDRAWWAIRQFLRRRWMTRLWTIQEAVLSKQLLFVRCGSAMAFWDDIAVWCYYLESSGLLKWLLANDALDSKYSEDSVTSLPPPVGCTIINSLQRDRLQGTMLQSKPYLLDILVSTRYAQAFEPKDKIYGVLGIAESDIKPNYSPQLSERDVYHEASLTQLPGLIYELLSCVDHAQPIRPSWVPDWSAPRLTEALGYLTKVRALYRAGGGRFMERSIPVVLSEDTKHVTLRGKIFDTVATLGCVSENPVLGIDDPVTKNRELRSYFEMARNAQAHPSYNNAVYEAFWMTLVAGRDGSGASAPTQEHSEVFSLILDSTTGEMPSLPGETYSPRRQKGYFTLKSLKSRKPAKILEDLRRALDAALRMRRFAITKKGYYALVPRGTQAGDRTVVFQKACVPFVVRQIEDGKGGVERYELLGETYVHGVMRGEVMDVRDLELEDVTLV